MRFKEIKENNEEKLPYEKINNQNSVPTPKQEDKEKLTRPNYEYKPNNNYIREYSEEPSKGKLRR